MLRNFGRTALVRAAFGEPGKPRFGVGESDFLPLEAGGIQGDLRHAGQTAIPSVGSLGLLPRYLRLARSQSVPNCRSWVRVFLAPVHQSS